MLATRYNILIVEPEHWEAGLLEEALAELEERRYRRLLGRGFQTYRASTLEEALEWVEDPSLDLLLLNPNLPDSQALHSYLSLRRKAPCLPVILLVEPEEESLGISAVREGAQDYLLKNEIDCLPLARSIRYALERSTSDRAVRHMPAGDPLTGLINRPGFLMLGQQILDSAARWNNDLALHLVDLRRIEDVTGASGRQVHDLLLLEAAEFLRNLCQVGDLLGRLGPRRLGVLALQPSALEIAAACSAQPVFFVSSSLIGHGSPGNFEQILSSLEQSLCENGPEDLKLAS
jgi:PleD family two-component response regulator